MVKTVVGKHGPASDTVKRRHLLHNLLRRCTAELVLPLDFKGPAGERPSGVFLIGPVFRELIVCAARRQSDDSAALSDDGTSAIMF